MRAVADLRNNKILIYNDERSRMKDDLKKLGEMFGGLGNYA